MPSGFQQDTNQLQPGFYRIVWVANTGTYPTADGNTNGAITPNSGDSLSAIPTTAVKAKQRARGNMRFRNVVNRLSGLADCQILDIETGISGGGQETSGDSVPTSLAFTVKYDRPAGLLGAVQAQLGSPYTGADGSTAITTTVLAIKDQFVRGFTDATTASMRVYDDLGADTQISITVAAPDAAADIWADTTVTQIDGTELNTLDGAGAAE